MEDMDAYVKMLCCLAYTLADTILLHKCTLCRTPDTRRRVRPWPCWIPVLSEEAEISLAGMAV